MPHLTKKLIMDLAPAEAPYKVSDEVVKGVGVVGLCVRVTPSGAKTFALQYRTREGKKGWMKIGRFGDITLEEARAVARKHKGTLAHGEDPAVARREAREAKTTVADLAKRFIPDHIEANNKPSTQKEHIRLLAKVILPRLGTRPVREVGTSEIATFLSDLRKETPVQANRVRSLLGKMFQRAELWEMRELGSNPVRGQDKTPEVPRDRRMIEAEIRAVGVALKLSDASEDTSKKLWKPGDPITEGPFAAAAVRLSLLAGLRKGEVLGLQWPWVDLENRKITIPADFHKTGKKTGKARIVYLGTAAAEVLKALPRNDEDEDKPNIHVIQGEREGAHLVQLQDSWERIRATATELSRREAKKVKGRKPVDVNDVHIHDLRRTFSSVGTDLGLKGFVGELLGHSEQTVTDIYTRAAETRLHEAAEVISAQIAEWLE